MGRLQELCEWSRNGIPCATIRGLKSWLRQGEGTQTCNLWAQRSLTPPNSKAPEKISAGRTERSPVFRAFRDLKSRACRLIHISSGEAHSIQVIPTTPRSLFGETPKATCKTPAHRRAGNALPNPLQVSRL